MSGVNLVVIMGNLGSDPELRNTSNGVSVGNISVATSRVYYKGEERVEETEWHRVVLWGRDAENASEYLRKGSQVHVQGRLQTRSWETDSGERRYSTEIVCEKMVFVGKRDEGGAAERRPAARRADKQDRRRDKPARKVKHDDDIPF